MPAGEAVNFRLGPMSPTIPPQSPLPSQDISDRALSNPESSSSAKAESVGASSSYTSHVNESETTIPTSMQPTTRSDTISTSSSISGGAIVGIAIGCLAIGFIAGFLGTWLLLRRSGKYNAKADALPVYSKSNAISGETNAHASTPAAAHDIQLEQFFPEATPDRTIVQEVQSLGGLVHQHVENYYHSKPVSVTPHNLSALLQGLGFSGIGPSPDLYMQTIAALCLNPKTRQYGLRHVILRATFGSIDVYSQNRLPSMLPGPVASFLQAIPGGDRNRSYDGEAMSLALRRWRTLSAFLLHPRRNLRTPLPVDNGAVSLQARELATSLNTFLDVFVDSNPSVARQQRSHLEAVVVECTKLGHILLSHPCDWDFITMVPPNRDGIQGLVIEAGLRKLSSLDGLPYPQPRTVVDSIVFYYDPAVP
ncbi:hypothetical protein NOR_06196 [Metarhizium rileyi]|uniref:Uncharacterized protein n=1 Tax=Metarhizium rileyi (strain RCEF 4871) TaxID=1649241 RepID=A0A162J4M3_METRR|nr:hypothetical protein NOR_06196 [Metarhizium rileyi RCEF 4871]